MVNVGIVGLGSCLPETVISNEELSTILDTNDEWIESRTGIKTRRVSTSRESLPILMSVAAKRALDDAKLEIKDIGYILAASNQTDPILVPHLAPRVQYLMDALEIPCIDLSAGCSGTNCAVETAVRFVRDIYETERMKVNVLVVGGDTMFNVTPMDDRRSAVVLADGAGAAIFSPEYDSSYGIKSMFNRANGAAGNLIHYESGFNCQFNGKNPLAFTKENSLRHFLMNGREVHKFISKKASVSIKELFEKAGLSLDKLSETSIIPHQMNLRSIDLFVENLTKDFGCAPKFVYTNGIVNYGNPSTASTLIGLDEVHREGKLDLGDFVSVVAFGAGLTWGGFLMAWNRYKPLNSSSYDLNQQRGLVTDLNVKYDAWKEKLAK